MKPLISVILPSYNHAKYISIAIESVLNQTFTNYELLISDDCSTDGTIDVIKNYHDIRIKTFFSQQNQGATFNHNFLISQAKGDFIALISSDDVWFPERLEKQILFMEQNPSFAACFSQAEFIDEKGNHLEIIPNVFQQPNRTQAEWLEYFYTKGNCICHPSLLIRRNIYQELGMYNLAMRQLPDFDMWIRVVKRYPIFILQESLVQHRRFIGTGQNTSTPTLENSMRDIVESNFILTKFFDDIPDDLFEKAFSKYFHKIGKLSNYEICCEKFFMLLDGRFYIPKISLQEAIFFFLRIYNSIDIAETFKDTYSFSLQDFHKISCQLDLLNLKEEKKDENPETSPLEERSIISISDLLKTAKVQLKRCTRSIITKCIINLKLIRIKRHKWFHIILWITTFLYLLFFPKLIDNILLTEGKPIQYEIGSIESTDILKYSVDRLDAITINKQDIFNLWGWAFAPTFKEQSEFEKIVVLESENQTYYFKAESFKREELQKVFKDIDIDLSYSGLKANIAKEALKPGSYTIGIIFNNKSNNDTYYQITNAKLLRTPNNLKLIK